MICNTRLNNLLIARIPRRNENDVDNADTTTQSKYEVLVGYEHLEAKIVVQDIKIQEKSYLVKDSGASTTPMINIDPNENDVSAGKRISKTHEINLMKNFFKNYFLQKVPRRLMMRKSQSHLLHLL